MSRRVIPLRPADRAAPPSASTLLTPPPLSLYIHVPWCIRKCPYCDFNSHALRGELPETAYLDALIRDLEHALPDIWGRRIGTIFIGGGTPSLISAAGIDRLLAAVRARVNLVPSAEITLEANPGAIEHAAFADLAGAGVTRLSLGIQSFNDRHLAALGRVHGRAEALAAAAAAARHFATFNLDLMAALPGQTLDESVADLDTALAFAPPHLSCYQLTIEPNTAFAHAPPAVPDEDAAAAILDAAHDRLAAAGYQHYETSAFCRPGHPCAHNRNYWQYGDYLGIGAGAHGKLSFPAQGIRRDVRHRHPEQYLGCSDAPVAESHWVDVADRPFEFMMNALRLNDGVDAALFPARTGVPLAQVQATLDALVGEDLLWQTPTRFGPTPRGQRYLNAVLQRFL